MYGTIDLSRKSARSLNTDLVMDPGEEPSFPPVPSVKALYIKHNKKYTHAKSPEVSRREPSDHYIKRTCHFDMRGTRGMGCPSTSRETGDKQELVILDVTDRGEVAAVKQISSI